MSDTAIDSAPPRVCMLCARAIGAHNRPIRAPAQFTGLVSHGVCAECAPAYCKDAGLTPEQTARVLKAAQ